MKCNLCRSEEGRILYQFPHYPDTRGGAVVRCRKCGLVYRHWADDEANEERNGKLQDPKGDYPVQYDEKRRNIFLRMIDEIEPFRSTNRVLDVGSGEGHFLRLCFERNWEPYGVDKRPELARKCGDLKGATVSNRSFEEADFQKSFFDVVTFLNVLDHMKDPLEALKKAYRIIRPGGGVLIRSPNGALHVRGRRVACKIYRIAKSVRRFDTFTISNYAFDRDSVLRYLWQSGFGKCSVRGDNSWLLVAGGGKAGLLRLWKSTAVTMGDRFYAFSHGNWIIMPSLLASGTKPGVGTDLK
jgi:2-polyprenyl-3-methyl-5-hydroxy-6-metoxy-1,4-benzoquinol methylase